MSEPRVYRKNDRSKKENASVLRMFKDQFKPLVNSFSKIFREQQWRMKIIKDIDTKALSKQKEKISKLSSTMVPSEYISAYNLV